MGESHAPQDTIGCADSSVPLTPPQKTIVIIAHYLTFVVCTVAFYATYCKLDILKKRINSPSLLLLTFVWLQIGPAFEIGIHHLVSDWELKEKNEGLINASFGFFNFGAIFLNAICLRKLGLKFIRKIDFSAGNLFANILDAVILVADIVFVIGVFVQPILYIALGMEGSTRILTAGTSVAGVFVVIRLWFNLGPNPYTKWGALLYLAFVFVGVFSLQYYVRSCVEFVHAMIGGGFVLSVIPISVAIWNVELPKTEEGDDAVNETRNAELPMAEEGDDVVNETSNLNEP